MRSWKLYVILDKELAGWRDLKRISDQIVKGGADAIQLRDKISCDRALVEEAKEIREITKNSRVDFIVNDRVDIAKAADADGVHLGQDDLPINAARAILGKTKLIGISCHSLSQAIEAQAKGADYIGLGPIFKTTTKPNLKPIGPEIIKEIKIKLKIPIVCIGGIRVSNLGDLIGCGIKTVAIASEIVKSNDAYIATRRIKDMMERKNDAVGICQE